MCVDHKHCALRNCFRVALSGPKQAGLSDSVDIWKENSRMTAVELGLELGSGFRHVSAKGLLRHL